MSIASTFLIALNLLFLVFLLAMTLKSEFVISTCIVDTIRNSEGNGITYQLFSLGHNYRSQASAFNEIVFLISVAHSYQFKYLPAKIKIIYETKKKMAGNLWNPCQNGVDIVYLRSLPLSFLLLSCNKCRG